MPKGARDYEHWEEKEKLFRESKSIQAGSENIYPQTGFRGPGTSSWANQWKSSIPWCQVLTMGEVVVCVFLFFFPKWLGLNKKDYKACKEIGENGRKQSNSPEIKQNELQENKDKGIRKMLNKKRVSTKSKYKEWNKLILELENTITELKNSPKGFNIRFDQVEERISITNIDHLNHGSE